ncbi:NERD domain-containing protein [Oceanobacillus salinisoli]|uniref:NERD domain-containing protein n=1 Tax=Oceanobacillus salinisoli TaxID=2678611 RepID=UPI001E5D8F12|nr:NERD domain-containing protein [Oceanobacillus salinisoli]
MTQTDMKGVIVIAQLIKLQDYISRYEWDTFRYPTQYIRVKKQNWDKLYEKWAEPERPVYFEAEAQNESEEMSTFAKFKALFRRESLLDSEEDEEPVSEPLPDTEEELKQYFLDKIFHFQLKWATSTVNRISFVHKKYYDDPLLKYLLQRFPDTYLLMYYPVFNIKKAPIDGEILLISPIGIEIIYFMEEDEQAVIMAGDERTWTVQKPNSSAKVLNPTIALKRTEHIINRILHTHDVEFPVYKTVLSRTNSIVFAMKPYQTELIGKNEYPNWFQEKRKLTSSLKNKQLKTVELLLRHCQSISVQRPEWQEDVSLRTIGDLEES